MKLVCITSFCTSIYKLSHLNYAILFVQYCPVGSVFGWHMSSLVSMLSPVKSCMKVCHGYIHCVNCVNMLQKALNGNFLANGCLGG
jgi:hypothetical protein